ncbi:MAG: polysaccharide deacetylase family protein [Marinoscillum sp.]|uniref:polysaccharide deacetylase family protein n=1 Tax=Marinoscillum sp. TaxID=2024838 RepID=UPI0032F444DD
MKQAFAILLTTFGFLSLEAQKQVAITYDDLVLNGPFISLEHTIAVNQQIIADCEMFGVPAVGFVNEKKLYVANEEDARINILKSWLDAGLELGNHTFSHPSLSKTPLADYQKDVLKGEEITRPLMKAHGQILKYFRHPYLHTGPDSVTKASFESFITSLGYEVAPVTVDGSDYIFNTVYVDALKSGDTALMQRTGAAYVAHTLRMFDFMEHVAKEVIGRNIAHIYLCHANAINADYMGLLYQELKQRGYEFTSLKEVLQDAAYQSEDHYIGKWGISWLYRWDKEKSTEWLKIEPEIDQEILSLYNNR